MQFSAADISPAQAYSLLTSTVVPRPIAFITTISEQGIVNAAPFSFFNAMGSEPPVVAIGFEPKTDGNSKDTPNNILSNGEFCVNLVDEALASQMNICAGNLPAEVSELDAAGLESINSLSIRPPRISAAPVSLECKSLQHVPLSGGGCIIIGEVLQFHLRDELVSSLEPLRVDLDKLATIARLSGPHYARITDKFSIQRPK